MSLADAVTREEAWFNADLSGIGLAPVTAALGGPFDVLRAYVRPIARRTTECYLWREHTTETRVSLGGKKAWHHGLVATIRWPLPGLAEVYEFADTDQAALDAAVDAVVARVRGPFADKTHGDRFAWVGEGPEGEGIQVTWSDPITSLEMGLPQRVDVRYPALEFFTA